MCRDYTDEPVEPSTLAAVLDAARRGPAAGNTDALDLVVLEGADAVADYWNLTLPSPRRKGFPWPGLLRAPVLVVPYVHPEGYVQRYGLSDKAHTGLGERTEAWSVPYWWVDGGAAVMAMLLAAEAAGLGALFFGQFGHERAVAELLGVPTDRRSLGTLALGHPRPGGRNRSSSAERGLPARETMIHHGRW